MGDRTISEMLESASDMAAFSASDAACVEYPSEDEAELRAAFCAGAAYIGRSSGIISALEATGCYWVLGKGKKRPEEHLYAAEIYVGQTGDVEAFGEGSTLLEALENALAQSPHGEAGFLALSPASPPLRSASRLATEGEVG